MSQLKLDVLVVGGGIHGVGIAQAVAAAGYSVRVLEKTALAAGTSSKSSKLIHGGLRYLESFEFKLVRECLRERALLLKLAPDLVQLQKFCVPVYVGMRRAPLLLRTGLSLYWLLSGCNPDARFDTIPQHRWDTLDGLKTDGLRSVFRYTDARTDDALLTEAVMRSARSLGAELVCPAEFLSAELQNDGVTARYRHGDQEVECTARVLVNAGGPWVNRVADRIVELDGSATAKVSTIPVELVQGTHIELPGEFGELFYYIESPRDGRAVFVMPRGGRLVVGTTEAKFRGNPDDVRPSAAEESYLLSVAGHYFPGLAHLRRSDLLASWAGARVLPVGEGHAFHRSRETILHPDRASRPRMLSVYGGKLTSYRATAEDAVAKLQASLPHRRAYASTAELRLTAG